MVSEPGKRDAISTQPATLVMDSATLYEMLPFLDEGWNTYRWAREAAVTLTTSLIQLDHLEVAPGPGPTNQASEHYARLIKQLQTLDNVSPIGGNQLDVTEELRAAKTWVEHSATDLAEAYLLLRTDPNFEPWLEHAKRLAWTEHAGRLNGLYNREFIPEISLILRHLPAAAESLPVAAKFASSLPSEDGLSELLERSGRRGDLLRRDGTIPEDISSQLEHGYIISAIIRGYFHQLATATALTPKQLSRHPFREGVIGYVSTRLPGSIENPTAFAVGSTQAIFASIILSDALEQGGFEEKLARWIQNIGKARKLYSSRTVDLDDADGDRRSERRAIGAAKKIDLISRSKWLDNALRFSCGAVGSTAPHLIHTFFPELHVPNGIITEVAFDFAGAALAAYGPVEKGQNFAHCLMSHHRLRHLARRGPGIVSYSSYKLPTNTLPHERVSQHASVQRNYR